MVMSTVVKLQCRRQSVRRWLFLYAPLVTPLVKTLAGAEFSSRLFINYARRLVTGESSSWGFHRNRFLQVVRSEKPCGTHKGALKTPILFLALGYLVVSWQTDKSVCWTDLEGRRGSLVRQVRLGMQMFWGHNLLSCCRPSSVIYFNHHHISLC